MVFELPRLRSAETHCQIVVRGFGRNVFDERARYRRYGVQPPEPRMEDYTVETYYRDNGFDLLDDIWPCQYCTRFNDHARFPNLATKRNFNEDCMPCEQTALTLRNVMSCDADVDLVVWHLVVFVRFV